MDDLPTVASGLSKEVEGNIEMGELPLTPTNQEANIPKEVSSAGVSVHPTTVPIPLTDDQIAAGLKKSVKVSIRWLAEWCVRKIKQMHNMMKKSIRQPAD